jgi:hypothetical protein
MAQPLLVSPDEQARLLRKVADDLVRDREALPPEVIAPIADIAARRLERLRKEAREAVAAAQAQASATGWGAMTEEEVIAVADEQIAAARAARRARGPGA